MCVVLVVPREALLVVVAAGALVHQAVLHDGLVARGATLGGVSERAVVDSMTF